MTFEIMNNSKILCLSFATYLAFKFPKAPSELGLVLFCLHTFLFNKKLISNVTYDAGRFSSTKLLSGCLENSCLKYKQKEQKYKERVLITTLFSLRTCRLLSWYHRVLALRLPKCKTSSNYVLVGVKLCCAIIQETV